MAVQQSKVSKMQVRIRRAANRYTGVAPTNCGHCGAPCLPHRACKKCGMYGDRKVLNVSADKE
ncbi:MAG: 50S ribosomal protein L32 [Lentisphaeria bacterium]